jgi:hypothetical protein
VVTAPVTHDRSRSSRVPSATSTVNHETGAYDYLTALETTLDEVNAWRIRSNLTGGVAAIAEARDHLTRLLLSRQESPTDLVHAHNLVKAA